MKVNVCAKAAISMTLVGCLALFASVRAPAQAVVDFYRGKQIMLVTSASVGGGYDQYARLLAKHMPRHILGEPNIIVQNMVGAEGLRAANYLYNVAQQDGSVIGGLSRNTGLARFYDFNNAGIQFDARKFHWLGSPQQEIGLFILSTKSGMSLDRRPEDAGGHRQLYGKQFADHDLFANPQCDHRHQAQADRRLRRLPGVPDGGRARRSGCAYFRRLVGAVPGAHRAVAG